MRPLLTLMALLAVTALPAQAEVVTVAAARVLEVETGTLLREQVLTIDGGRITGMAARRPGEAVTHDLGDVTLLPGLIDAHVHLIGSEGLRPDQALFESAPRAAISGVANARKTLAAGFTTVRDLGARDFADVALRDAIAAGSVQGPRMLVATSSLSSTGGHGDLNSIPGDIRVQRYSAVADGSEEIRHKVRENVKYGADWIKILATGGTMSAGTDPNMADYTEQELRAAVEAAREKNRDVAVHAHGTEGIKRAVRAGVRSVEHCSMLDDEAIRLIRERGAFAVPNPFTSQYMVERGSAAGYTDYQLAKAKWVLGFKLESLRKAIKAGLLVAYGTDSGVQEHGLNARQFAMFVDAGMSPLAAIQSATVVNARMLRMEGKVGTLKPGAYADLLAVRGNPLENVRALETPAWIMKEGRVFQ